jgi:glutamine synthetase
LDEALQKSGFDVFPVRKEKGQGQYEIAYRHRKNLDALIAEIEESKFLVEAVAQRFDAVASFVPVPIEGQPGSGLHVHLHLEDIQGRNLFTRDEAGDYSDALLHSMGGVLAQLPEKLACYAPTEASYARFAPTHDAPATISWGPNNRSVAIRLPNKSINDKHFEFRVPGADADPATCIKALLEGVVYGLEKRIDPGPPVHGIAHEAQYRQKRIKSN